MTSTQVKFSVAPLFLISVILLCLSFCVAPLCAQEKFLLDTKPDFTKELVKLDTRPGVTQKFLLFTPQDPIASIILFPGGDGKLTLSDSGWIKNNAQNLVVRIKEDLAKAGFTVALVDAPTDKQSKHGMHVGSFRCTDDHVQDISQVIEYLKNQDDIPVWLFGFSMGNHSATYLASIIKDKVSGLIIASSVTNWKVFNAKSAYNDYPNGILDLNLDQISVPALIVHHEKDYCKGCPPLNVPKVEKALVNSPKVAIEYITGGVIHTNSCGPLGHHGFKGREKEALSAVSEFIRSISMIGIQSPSAPSALIAD